MKEPYSEILVRYTGPESCMHIGNGVYEALTGVHVGQVLSHERNTNFGVPTLSGCAEGNICSAAKGEVRQNPAWSETLCTHEKLFTREPGDPTFCLKYGNKVRVRNSKGVI